MCANAFTMRSADTCIFHDPYMKKRPEIRSAEGDALLIA